MSEAPPPLGPHRCRRAPTARRAEADRRAPRLFAAFVVTSLAGDRPRRARGRLAAARTVDPRELAAGVRRDPASSATPTAPPSPSAHADPAAEGRRRLQVPRACRRRPGPMEPVRDDHLCGEHRRRLVLDASRPGRGPRAGDAGHRDRVPVRRDDARRRSSVRTSGCAIRGVIRKAELIIDLGRPRRLPGDPASSARSASVDRVRQDDGRPLRDQDQYFGGIVVMDAEATARRGFGDSVRARLGPAPRARAHHGSRPREGPPPAHVFGAPHPNVRAPAISGAGDLEGLRRLGTDAGCLE